MTDKAKIVRFPQAVGTEEKRSSVRKQTLKVLLRGHADPKFFDISQDDARRLFDAVQSESEGAEGSSFVVFDSVDLCVSINLRAAVFFHFLWDADFGTAIDTSDTGTGEKSPRENVHIYFGESATPTAIGPEAETSSSVESGRDYLNNMFCMLDNGGLKESHRLHVVDADGESAFFRVGDISLITAPLWALGDQRTDGRSGIALTPYDSASGLQFPTSSQSLPESTRPKCGLSGVHPMANPQTGDG